MDNYKFRNAIKIIFSTAVVTVVISVFLVYEFSGDLKSVICTLTGMTLLISLMALLHKNDDLYMTDLLSELSRLTDTLIELEEKQLFSDCEDNILSKFQMKITKLVRILKRKNQQSLKEQENIKSLVSDISHQLKTPIANLVMYSDFLKDESLSEAERKGYIDILCQSVQRLNFLSESMIKISRLESGIISLNMQEQSINTTVLKAVKDVYSKAEKKGTEIIYNNDKDIILKHDRNWTAEAVFNMLDNAVKYSARNSKIYLEIKSYGMFSAVEVRDENPPLPEDERAKIFMRFFRGSNSSGKEGIGIGLYLSREIAIRQGGFIKLKCTDDGNIFSLILNNSNIINSL